MGMDCRRPLQPTLKAPSECIIWELHIAPVLNRIEDPPMVMEK